MGRRDNGRLFAAGSGGVRGGSRGKSGGNSALFISPKPALQRLLDKPVMKEIKPVAVKKNATRLKKTATSKSTKAHAGKSSKNGQRKGAPNKSSVVPSRPTKAEPSKKIASS